MDTFLQLMSVVMDFVGHRYNIMGFDLSFWDIMLTLALMSLLINAIKHIFLD